MNEPPAQQRPPREDSWSRYDARMHALRTPLTVAMLQLALVRRHLRRGDDGPRLDAELARIERALVELSAAIAETDRAERNR